MKWRVIRVSLAFLVVAGSLLALLVFLTWDSPPAFNFLNDRGPAVLIESDPGKSTLRQTQDLYSFEADFNDVCARADAELPGLGLKILSPDRPGILTRDYQRVTSDGMILVSILGRTRLVGVDSGPKPSRYSINIRYHPRDGWVCVKILRVRPRSWPPQYFLQHLQRMWRRSANAPPSQNKSAGAGNKQEP